MNDTTNQAITLSQVHKAFCTIVILVTLIISASVFVISANAATTVRQESAKVKPQEQTHEDIRFRLPRLDSPIWFFDPTTETLIVREYRSETIYRIQVGMDGEISMDKLELDSAPRGVAIKRNRLIVFFDSTLSVYNRTTLKHEYSFSFDLVEFVPREISCCDDESSILYLTGVFNEYQVAFVEFDLANREIKSKSSLRRYGINPSHGKVSSDGLEFTQIAGSFRSSWRFDKEQLSFVASSFRKIDARDSGFSYSKRSPIHPTQNMQVYYRPGKLVLRAIDDPGRSFGERDFEIDFKDIKQVEWMNSGSHLVTLTDTEIVIADLNDMDLNIEKRIVIKPLEVPMLHPGTEVRLPLQTTESEFNDEAMYSLYRRSRFCTIENNELVLRPTLRHIGQNSLSVNVEHGSQKASQLLLLEVSWPRFRLKQNAWRIAVSPNGNYTAVAGESIQVYDNRSRELVQEYDESPGFQTRLVLSDRFLFVTTDGGVNRFGIATNQKQKLALEGSPGLPQLTNEQQLYVNVAVSPEESVRKVFDPESMTELEEFRVETAAHLIGDGNDLELRDKNLFDFKTGKLRYLLGSVGLPVVGKLPNKRAGLVLATGGREVTEFQPTGRQGNGRQGNRFQPAIYDSFFYPRSIRRPEGVTPSAAMRLWETQALCEVGFNFEANQVNLYFYRLSDGKLAQEILVTQALPFHATRLELDYHEDGFDLESEKGSRFAQLAQSENEIFVMYYGHVYIIPKSVVDAGRYPVPIHLVPPTNPIARVSEDYSEPLDARISDESNYDPRRLKVLLDHQIEGVSIAKDDNDQYLLNIDTKAFFVQCLETLEFPPGFDASKDSDRRKRYEELTGEKLTEEDDVLHLPLAITLVSQSGEAAEQLFGLLVVVPSEHLKLIAARDVHRKRLKYAEAYPEAYEMTSEQQESSKQRIEELDLEIAGLIKRYEKE